MYRFILTPVFSLLVVCFFHATGFCQSPPPEYFFSGQVADGYSTRVNFDPGFAAPVTNFDTGYVVPVALKNKDIMDVGSHSLLEYRRLFRSGQTPAPFELIGTWRGVNKGVAQLAGYGQFIKEFTPAGNIVIGDNIQVHQVSGDMLRCFGWQPKTTVNGQLDRGNKFAVKPPRGRGLFRRGAIISYRDGGNRKLDPVRLIVDKVVKIDDNHLLGRAVAKFGPLEIPVAYFVLERIR